MNTAIIAGNLCREPEVRQAGDRKVAKFTVAVNDRRERPLFMDCEAWGQQAEFCARFLGKGSWVAVAGKLKQDEWTGRDGSKRSKMVLVAEAVESPKIQPAPPQPEPPPPPPLTAFPVEDDPPLIAPPPDPDMPF